jgi:phenylacetic acid degradation operon negative regulatory protein
MGADTARRLLMTVMGEFLLPSGGAAWTATFIDVLGRFEIDPGTTRQALARTAAAGWLSSERVGRQTRWRLTASGEQLLVEGAKRIYEFAGPALDWDRHWLVVVTSVPESDRRARHLLRTRMTWAGLGSPAPGIWLGTHTDRIGEVEGVLERAGLAETANVFVAERLALGSIHALANSTWDLAGIETEYEQFLAEFSSAKAADHLRTLIELVHAWRRFPWRDPALPLELLPRDWKGARAAKLFHDRHRQWSPLANAEWQSISGRELSVIH